MRAGAYVAAWLGDRGTVAHEHSVVNVTSLVSAPMTTGAAPTPKRRTQAERSAATREALLDATIECLVRDGYAGTTTSRVALRAGVSRGAHLHHFQTRNALIAAALQQLAAKRHAEALAAADRLPAGPERLPAALDIIWSFYASQLFQAALDLWSAARTDPELRAQLVPIERDLDRQTIELVRRMFPEIAARRDFEPLVEMSIATARGLSLLDMLHPGSDRNRRQWESFRGMLVGLFEAQDVFRLAVLALNDRLHRVLPSWIPVRPVVNCAADGVGSVSLRTASRKRTTTASVVVVPERPIVPSPNNGASAPSAGTRHGRSVTSRCVAPASLTVTAVAVRPMIAFDAASNPDASITSAGMARGVFSAGPCSHPSRSNTACTRASARPAWNATAPAME